MAGGFEGAGVSHVNNGKVQKLLSILARSYYAKTWISMEKIVEYTLMSSFNQRIQEMREHGIDVKNKTIDGQSHYRMFTDPMTFNWSDYTARLPQESIKRIGKKVEQVPQENLFE